MTGAFERIEKAFEEFRSQVEHCRNPVQSDMADIRDAYNRFNRLRERYRHEAKARSLSPTEEAALRKVFKGDRFMQSVGNVRGISEHVETGNVELLDTDNVSFEVTAASSAAAVFAARSVYLTDTDGQDHLVDHLKWLAEAERRIASAIARAKGA